VSPLSRQQLLGWGLTGGALAVAGAAGLWWGARPQGPAPRASPAPGPAAVGGGLREPDTLSSADGLLELELRAAPAEVRIGDRRAQVHAFNASLPGPTLRIRAGDTLRVRMVNGLDAPTNLHVHGLHVSPQGNGDNPFVAIGPGEAFDYEFAVPADHPPGTYWYHPHHHGHVADQVGAGLYGAIVVEDPEPLPVTRERLLMVSDLSLNTSGRLAGVSPMEQMTGREGELVLVNGHVRPELSAAPGERERWRIINACPSRFLRLHLQGQSLRLLSRDRGRFHTPVDVDAVELVPGGRVELLVETSEGTSTLVASSVDRGTMPDMMGGARPGGTGPVDLLEMTVSGNPVPALPVVPAGPVLPDLRGETVSSRRTLDFAMSGPMMGGPMMGGRGGPGGNGRPGPGGMMSFTVNGRAFGPDRTDARVQAGTVEEWVLTNSSPMDHPIHLHVWPMQVIQDGADGQAGADGQDEPGEPRWADVVNVPAFGEVTVRVAFEDFTGRTVFHCHILDHEDLGMMGTVEVG